MSNHDQTELDGVKASCCAIYIGEEPNGSGYLVDESRVATCAHVVTSDITQVRVLFDGSESNQKIGVTKVEVDTTNDIAIITLDPNAFQGERRRTPLRRGSEGTKNDAFYSYGFGKLLFARKQCGEESRMIAHGGLLEGTIADGHARHAVGIKGTRIAALQLDCRSADDGDLHGWSGSPVVSHGCVVGQLLEIVVDPQNPNKATLGFIWATPIAVVERVAGLEPAEAPPDPQGANLEFTELDLRPPPEWASVYELTFQVVNTGNAKAILRTIKLVVEESHESETLRLKDAGAPVTIHHYHVRLAPDTQEIDIRGRIFGAPVEPRSFAPEEVEAFVVDIGSTRGYWYRFHLVAEWYEARKPKMPRRTVSPSFDVDLALEPEELLGRNSAMPALSMSMAEQAELVRALATFTTDELEGLARCGLEAPDILTASTTTMTQAEAIVSWARDENHLTELIRRGHQLQPGNAILAKLFEQWGAA